MTIAGKRLLNAATEALSIARGQADTATYVVHAPPETVDVRAIRKGLAMTQKAFGMRFGFGAARIRDWEQGRTRPAASDRVLLTTIMREPDAVLRALAGMANDTGEGERARNNLATTITKVRRHAKSADPLAVSKKGSAAA